jgi:hypothetical protein
VRLRRHVLQDSDAAARSDQNAHASARQSARVPRRVRRVSHDHRARRHHRFVTTRRRLAVCASADPCLVVVGLYTGLTPNLVGSGVSWGLYFFIYNAAKRVSAASHLSLAPERVDAQPISVFLCVQNWRRWTGEEKLGPAPNLLCAAQAGMHQEAAGSNANAIDAGYAPDACACVYACA